MALPTVPPPAAAWLFEELTAARLLAADKAGRALADFQAAGADTGDDAAGLADFLVQAGLLTQYQADRALAGHAARLTLGPYLLAEPVGSGSMGTVFRATHATTRRRVAVKVLPLRSMWNVLQAKRQVEVFARLPAHPAVVPFLDIDTAGGSHYLAWPFVEGETVDALVRRAGPLPPPRAARFAADVADGLAVCHTNVIVHGLLKPSNLMVGPDRRARILDLGIGAILRENLSDDESLMDTISTANTAITMMDCAAPETLADPTQRTEAGDIYSLGCVMYFLVTGRVPFPDGNAVDKIIAHQTEAPRPVRTLAPAVPAALAAVIHHCLAKLPADRPAGAAAVRDALVAAVPQAAPTAGPSLADMPPPDLQPTLAPWPVAANGGGPDGAVDFDAPATVPTRPGPRTVPQRGQDSAELDLFQQTSQPDDTPVSSRLPRLPRLAPARPAPPLPGPDLPPLLSWSNASADSSASAQATGVTVPPPPRFALSKWRKAVRRVFGWVPPRDVVQLSLFGPAELTPGQTFRFQVYAHPPEAFASVKTLSRAFRPDATLRGAGYASRPVARTSELGLHLTVTNAGVAKSVVRFQWLGQTRPWAFEVYVPWESPAGLTPGVLTVGLDNVQSAEIAFNVVVLLRSG